MVVEGRENFIYDLPTGGGRLFALDLDPDERHDLTGERPQVAERLERLLLQGLARSEGLGTASGDPRGSERVQDSLRALGYLE